MKEGNFLSMFLQLHLYFPFFMWSDQVFFKSAISSNEEINSGMNDNGNPSMVHRPWKHPNEFITTWLNILKSFLSTFKLLTSG